MERRDSASSPEQDNGMTEVIRARQVLNQLSSSEIELLLNDYRNKAAQEYNRMLNSYDAFFIRKNLFRTRELDLFDIPHGRNDDLGERYYLRTHRDENGVFSTRTLTKHGAKIVEYGEPQYLLPEFKYYFGPEGSMVATVSITDGPSDRSHAVRDDGDDERLRTNSTMYERGVLVAAYENAVLPQLAVSRDYLKALWHTIQANEQDQL